MRFACFGGVVAVADEAEAVARHRRGKFFFGNKGEKLPSRSKASSPRTKRITSPGRRDTDFDVYDMIAARKSTTSSVPSSSALSTAASLDSAYSSSSSSSFSSSRSSSSSSLSSLEGMPPAQPVKKPMQPDEQKRSPAVGAAAVLVCLVMMMFGGRFVATLLTAAVLCFFPRQWPAHRPAATRREAIDRKAVTDGFLARNRKK